MFDKLFAELVIVHEISVYLMIIDFKWWDVIGPSCQQTSTV